MKATLSPVRARLAISIAAAGFLLAGCGTSARDQVKSKVEQFASAAAHRDYGTLCSQVLAPSLVAHLKGAGLGCEDAMRIALAPVRNPALSIGKITVRGSKASVIALTLASGQTASISAIELVKTSHGWRIASLGSNLQNATR